MLSKIQASATVIALGVFHGVPAGNAEAYHGGSNDVGSSMMLTLVSVPLASAMVVAHGGPYIVKAVRPIGNVVSGVLEESGTGSRRVLELSGQGVRTFGHWVGESLRFVSGSLGTNVASVE